MRLLVLGGTVFLSREVAAEALRRGHTVVCACRGESGTVPEGATLVRWDRDEAVPEPLATDRFDAVVDVARRPSHVRRALAALPDARWVFVSTISVYADDADPGGPGVGRLHRPVAEDVDLARSPEAYGPMKVGCEQLVQEQAATAVVVRPGLIVGPGDPTGRFAYWARRLGRGGAVLAPGRPDDVVQVIDVRDLAAWVVTLAEQGPDAQHGGGADPVYDAVGAPLTFAELLGACAPDAELVWVDQQFLKAHGVQPWSGPESIPLWLPRPAYDGMLAHDAAPAHRAGLRTRPVGASCADTRAWLDEDPAAPVTGISAEREQELLADWRAR
ncbi:NAD-dependent epimerase/dehydratase family protein [Nocardioides sp. SYSU DS0651]|uniref:NAD-dependent epimerase/dehydratase family protein n=1 Tax=Nocardioides sp. SYSU DS0651 TaxID=3415955 RepID=UPI003F4C6173